VDNYVRAKVDIDIDLLVDAVAVRRYDNVSKPHRLERSHFFRISKTTKPHL
jgi:hypothetical protein